MRINSPPSRQLNVFESRPIQRPECIRLDGERICVPGLLVEIVGSPSLKWPITILECVIEYTNFYCDWSTQKMRTNDLEPWCSLFILTLVIQMVFNGFTWGILCPQLGFESKPKFARRVKFVPFRNRGNLTVRAHSPFFVPKFYKNKILSILIAPQNFVTKTHLSALLLAVVH